MEKRNLINFLMVTAELRRDSLNLFQKLLKVQRKAFVSDNSLIQAARQKTRQEFSINVNDEQTLRKKLKEGKEVCELIEHNILQAELVDSRSNEQKPYYKLNFRPEIEINDGHVKGKIGKCC